MARKKRPYIPKVKGCYQCSQRRIDCDGTRPCCSKCVARGIVCSGFDVRFRFRDGFVPASKRSKKRSRSCLSSDESFGISGFGSQSIVISDQDGDQRGFDDSSKSGETGTAEVEPSDNAQISDFVSSSAFALSHIYSGGSEDIGIYPSELEATALTPWTSSQSDFPSIRLSQAPDLGILEPWKGFLLKYFSDNIAPEMVVVDDDHNGWRHLVLPLACSDELVMNSVLAVSTFHLAGRVSSQFVADPSKLYHQAIRELQNRRDLTGCDQQTRQLIILAIVVLLVAVMVNGCPDFPIMFQMLQSAIDAVGGEAGLLDGGEMAEFSLRQIRKMRVYAAPLLSQGDGVYAIMCQAQESFDCLHYYDRLYPKHSSTFGLIADLRQQAFDIYLDRVLDRGATTASTGVIDHFMETVQSFPEGSPGEHVLVWPVFIAASESCSPEHHLFFEQFLERQYRRNGFINILRALELLRRIWTRNENEEWPALLPEPQVFIM